MIIIISIVIRQLAANGKSKYLKHKHDKTSNLYNKTNDEEVHTSAYVFFIYSNKN